jgi:hypothetical protein
MVREREDDDLTEADRQVMRLYEEEQKPIDWDESDDAILAYSREVHAGSGEVTAGQPANDYDPTVVPFGSRDAKPSFLHQIIHSPAMGFSLAACLMIGVFAGQGVMPYVDLGVSPGYDDVVEDNKRLQGELNQVKTQLTRSLAGIGAPAEPARAGILALTQALSGFDCASLSATLSKDMKITVSGYVASEADLQTLGTRLAEFGNVAAVVNQARVAGWPSCEVLDILHQKASAPANRAEMPAVGPFQHGPAYAAGEKLVVEAEATSLYDGFLYVDFIQHDGTVLHMLPGDAAKAGERVLLGNGPQEFTIAPPYGTEMLVVLSSPVPLFEKDRPQVEKAKAYLGALKRALDAAEQKAGAGKVFSNYSFVTTGATPPQK